MPTWGTEHGGLGRMVSAVPAVGPAGSVGSCQSPPSLRGHLSTFRMFCLSGLPLGSGGTDRTPTVPPSRCGRQVRARWSQTISVPCDKSTHCACCGVPALCSALAWGRRWEQTQSLLSVATEPHRALPAHRGSGVACALGHRVLRQFRGRGMTPFSTDSGLTGDPFEVPPPRSVGRASG